jgi:hypothetical protein
MNPNWIPALCAVSGLFANLVWTLVNLRLEARVATEIQGLREWVNENFVRRTATVYAGPSVPFPVAFSGFNPGVGGPRARVDG